MHFRVRIFITASVAALFIFGTAFFSQTGLVANNSGAPAVHTGSPGDNKNCTVCHSGTAQNASGLMSSNVPASGYIPGATYQVTASVADAAKNRFGFEISPQNMAGAKLGTITLTEATRTKLVGSGKYITHTSSGTAGTGANSWTFNWTAPQPGAGDVTFYGAFNFSNHNNASSGDVIKLCQMTITEDLFTLAVPSLKEAPFQVFPNPTNGLVHFQAYDNAPLLLIRIFSMDGRQVYESEENLPRESGQMDLTAFAAGTYYVSFTTEKGEFNTRLIKL